jgi:CRP-like cAMP-binding protein
MYEKFIANLGLHVKLSEQEQAMIIDKLHQKIYKKGEYLLKTGQVCNYVFFVNNGCLRSFYTDTSSVEHNILLHMEGWWAGAVASFSKRKKSRYSIHVLEQAEIFALGYEDLETLLVNIPQLERFFRILYQNGFSFYQDRMIDMLSQTAEERYRKFRKIYPGLELRIPQKQIASFLGITPVFLSILRGKYQK